MVKKIERKIFRNIYFVASAVALLLFIVLIWYIRKDTEKEMDRYVNTTTKNIAVSNINIVNGMIENYAQELFLLKTVVESEKQNANILSETIQRLKEEDTVISKISIDRTYKTNGNHKVFVEFSEQNKPLLYFVYPLNKREEVISLSISLDALHRKIALSKNLSQAYTTVTVNGRYVFHPDEKLLGKTSVKEDNAITPKTLNNTQDTVTEVWSDYLEMNVYRYRMQQDINGQSFVFTANVPNLGVKEYAAKTLDAFLVIFLCGIFVFLFIFLLGILRWRAEFVKRKEVENQNLTLQLKNEQQKQTVTATKLEILKSGLNPHFLFNSLGNLSILVGKNPDLAKQFSTKLSAVYRYLLKHETQNKVKVSQEMAFTDDYLQLQKIRFSNKIHTQITISDMFMNKKIPPVSIQLLVENCIKHTIISDDNPLQIHIFEEDNYLVVSNNYNPRLSEIEHSGKGIENLKKRYALLTDKQCYFSVIEKQYIAKIPILG